MALGFTGAVRLGIDEATSTELFVAILGCNIAWGIVDGVMYAMQSVFERGRLARLLRTVRTMDDDRAIRTSDAPDRAEFGRIVLRSARRSEPRPSGLRADDVRGGIAVAALIVMTTAPLVAPFLFIEDAWIAARVSNGVALAMLLLLGMRWGSYTGDPPWRIGAIMVGLGIALVGVTILLGG
jgi:VIT1/CCC1 family predicted Fe2+/Mn2+ transporter